MLHENIGYVIMPKDAALSTYFIQRGPYVILDLGTTYTSTMKEVMIYPMTPLNEFGNLTYILISYSLLFTKYNYKMCQQIN